jgi:hypothetical protein
MQGQNYLMSRVIAINVPSVHSLFKIMSTYLVTIEVVLTIRMLVTSLTVTFELSVQTNT